MINIEKKFTVIVLLFITLLLANGAETTTFWEDNFLLKPMNEYKKMVEGLIQDFKTTKDKERKRKIIMTLGWLRARAAIPLLIENIDFYYEAPGEGTDIFLRFPAIYALSATGALSQKYLIEAIKQYPDVNRKVEYSEKNVKFKLFLQVLVNIQQASRKQKEELAITALEEAQKPTKDPLALKNLDVAKTWVK